MPYRRLDILTPLSPGEVRERLQKITRGRLGVVDELLQTYRRDGEPEFVGSVTESGFDIHRDIRHPYRHPLLPIIRGRVVSHGPRETLVRIRIRLRILSAISLAFVLLACVMLLWSSASFHALPLPAAVAAAAAAIGCIRFYLEARGAERLIRQALGAPG